MSGTQKESLVIKKLENLKMLVGWLGFWLVLRHLTTFLFIFLYFVNLFIGISMLY